jgi:hypothetical protein
MVRQTCSRSGVCAAGVQPVALSACYQAWLIGSPRLGNSCIYGVFALDRGAARPAPCTVCVLFGACSGQVIACLSLPFQIAQALHAVNERPVGRANHVVDLRVPRDLIDDLPVLRRACETTVDSSETHAWPPSLEVRQPGSRRHQRPPQADRPALSASLRPNDHPQQT